MCKAVISRGGLCVRLAFRVCTCGRRLLCNIGGDVQGMGYNTAEINVRELWASLDCMELVITGMEIDGKERGYVCVRGMEIDGKERGYVCVRGMEINGHGG